MFPSAGLVDSATAKRKHIIPSPPHPQDHAPPAPPLGSHLTSWGLLAFRQVFVVKRARYV